MLGGLLLSERSWEKIADTIAEPDFYREDHRYVFRAINELHGQGRPCDAVTVSEWFEANGESGRVDGGAYITQLVNVTSSAANIAAYADIVREKSILRSLIDVGTEIAAAGYATEGKSPKDLLEQAEQLVFAIADRNQRAGTGYVSIQDTMKLAFAKLEELSAQKGNITGVATGFADFDKVTAGLQPADLIIIAGRPSMGKTAFAMNITVNAAIRHKVPVVVFSMEMSAMQLVNRLFSSLGQIDQTRLRTGKLHDTDWPNLTSAMTVLHNTKIFIDDTPSLSPVELRARARRLKREHDIGLIVVDYLQLMVVPATRENRATEIAEISRSLKALAKELDIPVVALSQLNRALEQRPNKRPVMADLRESGSIEQDADLIAFIYRDEVYNQETAEPGKAEIIIGKHRNGATGTTNLIFQGQWVRFVNYTPE